MTYDIVRWVTGVVLFVVIFVVAAKITKNKGKSAVSAAFAALIVAGVMFLVPVENFVYSFKSVEQAYEYKHHEAMITYVECDDGALCIAQKNDGSFICYTVLKSGDGYKLPQGINENIKNRSSKYGIFIYKEFDNQSLIVTQIRDASYNENKFIDNGNGYYYTIVDGKVSSSSFYVNNERVSLV